MSALSERINAANHQRWNSRQIEARAKKEGFTLSNGTAFKILKGTHGVVSDDTLHALGNIFGIEFDELRSLVGLPAGDEPWTPPVVSSRLTSIQRELLEQLIHQLVRPTESAGTDRGTSAKKSDNRLQVNNDETETLTPQIGLPPTAGRGARQTSKVGKSRQPPSDANR